MDGEGNVRACDRQGGVCAGAPAGTSWVLDHAGTGRISGEAF